jgi:chemotaxis protein methyltransferase CheR
VNGNLGAARRDDASQLEIELLLLGLEQAYAADFRHCSRKLVAEAVGELLAAHGLPSAAALLHETLHDADLGRQAVAMLEASRLELFGEPDFFQAFRQRIVPWLRTYPFVSVWAPQCGDASDLYSAAILLDGGGLLSRTRIYATDADGQRLACAQSGVLAPASVRLAERNYWMSGGVHAFDAYIEKAGDGAVAIAHRLKRAIVWAQFSLESGHSFNEFNLILCRDALSGLPDRALRGALGVMTQSLSLSGLLVLGRSDTRAAALLSDCFRTWSGEIHVHQKVR